MYFIRIKIGDGDEFVIGDGKLRSCSVMLAEGTNNSYCNFTIYDPTKKYAEKYFKFIYSNNGLTPLPPVEPTNTSTDNTDTSILNQSSINADANTKAFLDMIARAEGSERYNILFGGGTFQGYADHPRRVIQGSSAAGRYQILQGTYDDAKRTIGVTDFTPNSQDQIAIWLIRRRDALSNVQQGNIAQAIEQLDETWTSFQVKDRNELIAFWRQRVQFYTQGQQGRETANNTVQGVKNTPTEKPPTVEANVGSQCTVELGYQGEIIAASSFLHTSVKFGLYNSRVLEFGCQSAAWVLTEKIKNTAYTNITFKEYCEKVTSAHGMRLDFQGTLNPKYEYFPQRGITDYDCLLSEARRLGYRVTTVGNTLKVYDRRSKLEGLDAPQFVFEYADTLGLQFDVSHVAQTDRGDGARSSNPNERSPTGQRKTAIDPGSGTQTSVLKESLLGSGTNIGQNATTGSDVAPVAPETMDSSDTGSTTAQANESRIKGIKANLGRIPFNSSYLLCTPDDVIATRGITETLDRVWTIESVQHDYDVDSGFFHTFNLYSPLISRVPEEATPGSSDNSTDTPLPPANPNGFIKPTDGVKTSGFRTARRPRHQGVDISRHGARVWASQDGVVADVVRSCPPTPQDGCGGGYGNRVYINHQGGFQTRYAHMKDIPAEIVVGKQVKQGDRLGTQANSGSSRGVHLHFEIRLNGEPQNPERYITI